MKTQHKSIALLVSLALLLTVSIAGTMAYLVDKSKPVQNTFQPVNVPPTVEEDFNGNTKENVQIRNNGNIPAYIRAQIVVNWISVDAAGKVTGIYGGAAPKEDADYIMTINTADWTKGSDGFYYHKTSVKANDNTSVLISSASLKDGTIPPDGYQLSVEILAQSIQAEGKDEKGNKPIELAWGVDIENGVLKDATINQ